MTRELLPEAMKQGPKAGIFFAVPSRIVNAGKVLTLFFPGRPKPIQKAI
jgi:hypothetical protein